MTRSAARSTRSCAPSASTCSSSLPASSSNGSFGASGASLASDLLLTRAMLTSSHDNHRVQDFNVPSLVALFLPYHNTPHFPSALNLIAEATMSGTAFAGFLPAKKSLAPVDLTAIVDLLPPFDSAPTARPLLDFILHLPLSYLENGEVPHRALTAFWLQAVASYLDRAGARLPDGERAAVLSTVLEVLRTARSHPDTPVSYTHLTLPTIYSV